jgi:hypothetical protein
MGHKRQFKADKEIVTIYLRVLSSIHLERLGNTTNTDSQDISSVGQDWRNIIQM